MKIKKCLPASAMTPADEDVTSGISMTSGTVAVCVIM
jgi:hypothetical protein